MVIFWLVRSNRNGQFKKCVTWTHLIYAQTYIWLVSTHLVGLEIEPMTSPPTNYYGRRKCQLSYSSLAQNLLYYDNWNFYLLKEKKKKTCVDKQLCNLIEFLWISKCWIRHDFYSAFLRRVANWCVCLLASLLLKLILWSHFSW